MSTRDQDWERVATIGIVCALLGVVAIMTGIVLASLSDTNVAALGHWIDEHGTDIWKTVAGAATAAATFLFGHRRGRTMGRNDAEVADAAAAEGLATGSAAAAAIEAKAEQRRRRR